MLRKLINFKINHGRTTWHFFIHLDENTKITLFKILIWIYVHTTFLMFEQLK